MRRWLLAAAWFSLAVLLTGRADAQPRPAAPKLDGTWEGFVVEGKGEQPNRGPFQMRLVVRGNKMVGTDLRSGRPTGTGTFAVDAARKTLDSNGVVLSAGNVNRAYLGIYELDGDTLKWCVSNHQVRNRPDGVVSRMPQQYYMILKRKP